MSATFVLNLNLNLKTQPSAVLRNPAGISPNYRERGAFAPRRELGN
jgi:hypothetical protein